jgi:hypothetical protein
MALLKRISCILILFGLFSCTEKVDLDQLDDAQVQSEYLFTLVYFELSPKAFLSDNGEELALIKEQFELPIRGGSNDYIERVEFTVVTENSFNREFSFKILFFNILGEVIYTLSPAANVSAQSGETTYILEIPAEDLDIIYNTEEVGFEMNMAPSLDGSTLQADDPFLLRLRSSVTFYINLEDL